MDIPEPWCVLCNQVLESASHRFLKCPAAKPLWFTTCWGFKHPLIGAKFKECAIVFSKPQAPIMVQPVIRWSPSPLGFIKLNVNAAIAQNNSALAVVARNEHGTVLKAWSKILPKRSITNCS
ncbi:hypothetical protein SO802_003667 [Lithocarpus litseifolius]|uniref:Reverse transcriptase zinc-binding domain-containing protein n=1 Tax=Lithocarpus litseifolius TaxID=425828 RepID=A0AAW2E4M2_9ROSI